MPKSGCSASAARVAIVNEPVAPAGCAARDVPLNGEPVALGHTGLVTEIPLRGGFAGEVVRLGDTVRRAPKARAEFVHRLLRHFEDQGWPALPVISARMRLDLGPGTDDIAEAASRLRLICDTYGLRERPAVIDTILWWQQRCWRGIDAGADDGDAAMVALREAGAVDAIRAAHRWVLGHRSGLISAH